MVHITLGQDADGLWTLTRPLNDNATVRLRLSIETPGTLWDWHSFTAAVAGADSEQWLVLGVFEISPPELYPVPWPPEYEITPWNPADEEDFQQISFYRTEFAEMVRLWGRIVDIVVPEGSAPPARELRNLTFNCLAS